jgi:superoxide dismutase, Fe-Mn family
MSSLGPTKVVFIAEDDADFRAALGATLTEAGLRVVLFPTADKLLGSLDRATPTIIVTDVSMPGLSGPELLHRLRLDERLQRIPVVVMTANNDTALPIRLNVPVVYKPDTEGLVAVIQRLPTSNLNEEETMTRYTLPDLPYAYDALEPHISAEIMELHHDKHHRAYVDGANKAIDKLIDGRSRRDYSNLATLERQLAFNVSGHILHSIFWRNLTPKGGAPGPGLTAAIERDFGSFVAFQEQLVQTASTIMGSGWAALVWDPASRRLGTTQIYDHQSNVTQAGIPLMVVDAWEHAYYLQYRTKKADYFAALSNLWNWKDVESRFERARSVDLALENVAVFDAAE